MGPLPSSGSVTLATLAAAVAAWTEFLSSSRNFAVTVVQIASLPVARVPLEGYALLLFVR